MENENATNPSATGYSPTPRVTLLETALVMVVTFFLIVFLGGILYLINAPIALVVGELLALIVPLAFLLLKKIGVKNYIRGEFKLRFLFIGVGMGIVLLFIDFAVSGMLTVIFGPSQAVEEANKIMTNISQTPVGLIAVVASSSLAGICEEFAFRGFLQSTINRRYSFVPALLVSAAVFGLFHFDPQLVYIISAFAMGLFLGYIYHRWDSYVVSATAHATLDIIVLILLLLTL
jgi:membrane protease YdiL (CAAX protease family)